MKNSLQRIALAILTVGLISVWILSIDRTANESIEEVRILISSVEGVKDLITEEEVSDMLTDQTKYDLDRLPMKFLDLRSVEEAVVSDTRVHKAEVFVDAQRTLTIQIEQRRPIMRVITSNGEHYYIDQRGNYIAKTEYRSVRVPVITGDLEKFDEDWMSQPDSKLKTAFDIATAVSEDMFLTSLIEQIHFEKGRRVVLIPKIGNEKIVLDYTDDLERKLKRLRPFYKDMAKKNNWDKYTEIDISYNKQVIGRNPVSP